MKIIKTRIILIVLIAVCFLLANNLFAQIDFLGKIKDKVKQRVEQKSDEAIDEGLNKTEEGINYKNQKEKNKKKGQQVEQEESVEEKPEAKQDIIQETVIKKDNDLKLFSKYDFVPGDKVIYFEDFSQDVVGEFPALWNTNKSGEVQTTSKYSGNWFMMKDDGFFWWEKPRPFPANFTLEFDIIPTQSTEVEGNNTLGIDFTLLETSEDEPYPSMLVPGKGGVILNLNTLGGEHSITGYVNGEYIISGNYQKESGLLNPKELNHIAIWVQKTRVRLYIKGEKIFDLPRILPSDIKLDQIRFWTFEGMWPLISNIRIAETTGDMRSKLLTEGKIVTYGIYFDSGSDKIKPESYGTLKEIAEVLKQNPDVKVKIVGHTDSDGDDKSNLDLSKRRAASVKNTLVNDFQIEATRMETDGKGESQPISDNKTREGKANNRRVEFIKM